ncbi:MAG: hypothetical protein ABI210_09145 [Abditibacteriaceae bacterium]
MKSIGLLLVLLLGTLPALANDMSIIGVGGSLRPLHGQHPRIRMVREKIDIVVGRYNYKVRVNFVFRNQGKASTVRMGFPESGGGGDMPDEAEKYKSTFLAFSSSVDGKKVPVKRVLLDRGIEDFEAIWVKTVKFSAGQTRQVQVDYTAPIGGASGIGYEQLVGYDFTGGNWAGDVDSSILDIHFQQSGDYLMSAELGDKRVAFKPIKNGIRFSWQHWQAQGSFLLRFCRTAPQWMSDTYSPDFASQISVFKTVNIPGTSALTDRRFDWFPPAFYNEGIAYISLTSFLEDLQHFYPETHPSLVWNPTTRAATLKVQKETYVFQPNKLSFEMNNSKMSLSTPLLLIRGHSDEGGSKLYVPLAPVILALRGTYHVNRAAHRYRFSLPIATQ